MAEETTPTKTIYVRVPIPTYIDILQIAADNKMNISDFATKIILENYKQSKNNSNGK